MSKNRCPHCKNAVLQKSGTGTRVRIEGPVIFANGTCLARCYWCKGAIELPLELQKGAGESFIISQP